MNINLIAAILAITTIGMTIAHALSDSAFADKGEKRNDNAGDNPFKSCDKHLAKRNLHIKMMMITGVLVVAKYGRKYKATIIPNQILFSHFFINIGICCKKLDISNSGFHLSNRITQVF